jgi:hypothetical protein
MSFIRVDSSTLARGFVEEYVKLLFWVEFCICSLTGSSIVVSILAAILEFWVRVSSFASKSSDGKVIFS